MPHRRPGTATKGARAIDRFREVAVSMQEQLSPALLRMKPDTREFVNSLIKAVNNGISSDNTYNDAKTTTYKLLVVLDSATRAVAIANSVVAAYRAGGDAALDAYVNWNLAMHRESVTDAENSAKHARGLWMTRRDQLQRQITALKLEISQLEAF
jgi:hypothetical protein